MERMSGIPLQQHEPIVGSKVFAHESGIHTQAMLIDRRMYEAVPAELVGGETSWVFGKHTGAALVEDTLRRQRERLARAGIEPTRRARASRHRRGQAAARRARGVEQERRDDRALRNGDAPALAQRRRRRRNRHRAGSPG